MVVNSEINRTQRLIFKNIILIIFISLVSGCSSGGNYRYRDFQREVSQETVTPLNLSKGNTEGPIIYFQSKNETSLLIPYHRLLLVHTVDGKTLPGVESFSMLHYDVLLGYQAIKLTPGMHSIKYCWVSFSKLGGGSKCNFQASNIQFDKNTAYMVKFEVKDSPINGISVKTWVSELESEKIISRESNSL